MKKCKICSIEKEVEQFHKCKGTIDGRFHFCKSCHSLKSKAYSDKMKQNPEWVEKQRLRSKDKYRRLGNKPKPYHLKKLASVIYERNYPEKVAVRNLSRRLPGKEPGYNLHHWSYNVCDAKSIIKLTIDEHNKAHGMLIYDQENKLYRTLSNVLLDNIDKHIDYLKQNGINCDR